MTTTPNLTPRSINPEQLLTVLEEHPEALARLLTRAGLRDKKSVQAFCAAFTSPPPPPCNDLPAHRLNGHYPLGHEFTDHLAGALNAHCRSLGYQEIDEAALPTQLTIFDPHASFLSRLELEALQRQGWSFFAGEFDCSAGRTALDRFIRAALQPPPPTTLYDTPQGRAWKNLLLETWDPPSIALVRERHLSPHHYSILRSPWPHVIQDRHGKPTITTVPTTSRRA